MCLARYSQQLWNKTYVLLTSGIANAYISDTLGRRFVRTRLQNSPYFCILKYAREGKQKVWNEAENRDPDWGETLKMFFSRFTRPTGV